MVVIFPLLFVSLLIQTRSRHKRWDIQFWLISATLLICFFGVILLSVHEKDSTKDVKKSGHVFEREKGKLAQLICIIREISQDSAKKVENAKSLKVDDIPLLTLFTSWVDRKDKYIVHNRTIENWKSFWPHVQPVIFTNDITLGCQCQQRQWNALTLKHTAAEGVPVLKYMYVDTMRNFNSVFYGFSNSDILFNDGLIKTLVTVRKFIEVTRVPVLISGRRINVDYKIPCNASDLRNITTVSKKGELVNHFSADYFITTKDYPWEEMEEIIIGRIRVDNWIIQYSQLKNVTVIDSTPTIVSLHQTIETGNGEGASKENKFYYVDIVRKVRNITTNINQGQTYCAEYVTDFTRSALVRLVRQILQTI